MKTTKQKIAICILLLIVSFGTNLSAFSHPKPTPDLNDFQIKIKSTKTGIKLIGKKGCAFTKLEFPLKNDVPQAIDRFGLTSLGNDNIGTDKELTDFLFTIKKTKDGFALEGIKGTAWIKLGFDYSGKVDQFGVR